MKIDVVTVGVNTPCFVISNDIYGNGNITLTRMGSLLSIGHQSSTGISGLASFTPSDLREIAELLNSEADEIEHATD